MKRFKTGYTLLELILVIGILVIVSSIGSAFLFGQKLSTEVEEEAKKIASVLRTAQSKAINLEENSAWGVHFDNVTASAPFYDSFRGTNYAASTSTERYYLSENMIYQSPASGTSTEVIFNKRSGTVTASATTTITIRSTSPQITKNITIGTNGRVVIQ